MTTLEFRAPDRRGLVLFVLAGVLLIAVVLWPAAVAGWATGDSVSLSTLPGLVSDGFARWVQSGQASAQPLDAAVSFWMVFHVVKAATALALLVVLVPVGRRIWGAYARAESRGRRVALWLLGAVGAPVVPVLLLIVMANVQGAVAPLSSVMNFLLMDGAAVQQVRGALASGQTTGSVAVMIGDFRLYHAALVVTAVASIVAVMVATVVLWVRRYRTPREQRRLRRVLAAGGMLTPMMLLFLGVVLLANLSTVADTAPALAAFFDGSGM